jgi:hypothetical protein
VRALNQPVQLGSEFLDTSRQHTRSSEKLENSPQFSLTKVYASDENGAFGKQLVLRWVGGYNIVLLLFCLLRMMTQVQWEGFGLLPLMAVTLPWSPCVGLLAPSIDKLFDVDGSFRFPGSSLEATLLIQFAFFQVSITKYDGGIRC